MAEFPALPLFTDAYLADTRHLTTVQHGAYLLMLMTAWRSGGCCLLDDDNYLARITGLDKRTWIANKAVLLSFWHLNAEQKWQQGRLLDERNFVEQVRIKNVAAGKASALKRLNRDATSVQPKANQNPTPSPTPHPEEERKKVPTVLSKEKLKSNFPDQFSLDMTSQKVADNLGLTDNEVLFEIEAMRDWAVNAGAKGLRKDWQAFARTWFRNNKGKRNGKNSANTITGGLDLIKSALIERRNRESDVLNRDSQPDTQDLPRLLKIAS